ncbi:hypothetical protein [Nocardiopsis kunsanensis]|uniref:Uncharacterized protein n=1 Tax=Nocardiopsis kunsanensis TaxID=141693 RepID=A0A919CJE5_9ACTN|nr:hypothetical protein [Nocardiopsis kunsanensis]GHD30844.1 hypothetical protein GCM10007147_32960 [Nocardiopsis kunsanensis]
MFRIAISRLEGRLITPVRRESALSVEEAVRAVRGHLPGAGTDTFSDDEVQSSVNRINDFRQDVVDPDGQRHRVVIAPMI